MDGEGERPLSLVSTLSSGSSRDSHSLFESIAALPCSTTPPVPSEDDVDLELSPTQGAGDPSPPGAGSRGRWQERLKLRVIGGAGSRKSSGDVRHVLVAPVVTDAMAPNPKLTYVDRVVMEIIETERMYVKDLRSIVEVRGSCGQEDWLRGRWKQIMSSVSSCWFWLQTGSGPF